MTGGLHTGSGVPLESGCQLENLYADAHDVSFLSQRMSSQ
jgi:hypothetical protein